MIMSRDVYDGIRLASAEDIPSILTLIEPLEARGVLIKRPPDVLARDVDSGYYYVYTRDDTLLACAQLKRYSASHALGVPCADPPLCVSRAHAQDKLWCEQAVKMGYDSIQIARPHLPCLEDRCLMSPPGWLTELAICKGRCMTEAVYDACPPGIELRTAKGEQCNCPSGAPLLNCGANSTLYGRPDHGTQVMSALKCIEQ